MGTVSDPTTTRLGCCQLNIIELGRLLAIPKVGSCQLFGHETHRDRMGRARESLRWTRETNDVLPHQHVQFILAKETGLWLMKKLMTLVGNRNCKKMNKKVVSQQEVEDEYLPCEHEEYNDRFRTLSHAMEAIYTGRKE